MPPPAMVPTEASAKRLEVSSGVQEGLLMHRVAPLYPRAAVLARIQGEVVLTAVISAEGRVEELQVQSGHPLLIAAALEAVKQWRYRPYLLNGKPTEVGARITVAFHLDR
jgi:protein TonB